MAKQPASPTAGATFLRLAAARHAVLWAARPAQATEDPGTAEWLQDWVHVVMVVVSSQSAPLERRKQAELLAQLSGVAAWLLQGHQRGWATVWVGPGGESPGPIPAACEAL